MNLGPALNNIPSFCISIGKRGDRRNKMTSQMKRKKLSVPKFLISKKNEDDPIIGCQQSHLNAINTAISKNYDKILILEDDAKFITKPMITSVPDEWDILYLGGIITKKYDDIQDNWVRVNTTLAHAYILNLNNKNLIKDINNITKSNNKIKHIDQYFNININPKYKCYMHNPMIMTQDTSVEGDVLKNHIDYGDINCSFEKYQVPQNYSIDDQYVLILPEIAKKKLPNVSLITSTRNRNWAFSIAYENFSNIAYPKHKLEWIIIDDSANEDLSFKNYINENDKRIKYIQLDKEHSIYEKRKIGIENANYDYLTFFDDDDYYPITTIISRIKILIKYKEEINCIGSSTIGLYDIVNKKSGIINLPLNQLCESSLMFTRNFWNNSNFENINDNLFITEFLKDRFSQIIDMPYFFSITCFAHGMNKYENYREIKTDSNDNDSFLYDRMSDSMKKIVDQYQKYFESVNRNKKILMNNDNTDLDKPKLLDINNNSNQESPNLY